MKRNGTVPADLQSVSLERMRSESVEHMGHTRKPERGRGLTRRQQRSHTEEMPARKRGWTSRRPARYTPAVEYFRAMTPSDDGLPALGRSARSLGVRIGIDIHLDEASHVEPGTGGMSVAPQSVWNVPNHRRPRTWGRGSTGPVGDCVYRIGEALTSMERLSTRADPHQPVRHVFVEPIRTMTLESYEAALAATRPDWQKMEPV
jgi:hypothetical protein